jgi:polysaccharide pyruvyl transferase WcaK-like protein
MAKQRILFLGTHGQYNIGDELLLETFLTRLGTQRVYAVNSYDLAYTRRQLGAEYEVDIFPTTGSKLRFLQQILRADLLFFGGGSIIKELYASVGRHRYATLFMIWLTVTVAHWLARKPIIMSNIGVGPLLSPGGARIARHILRQVTFLSVRDARSLETCLRLGVPADRVMLVPDAVFSLAPTDFVAAAPVRRTPNQPLRVALNLNFNIERPDHWEPFLDSLAAGLREFHAKTPIVIHALPMQTGFKEHDDAQVLAQFARRIPEIEMVMHHPATHHEIGALLADCDVVVAERLHALVIAAILGKPFLGLMYDVKVRELVAGLEQSQFALDVNRPFTAADVSKRLTDLCARPEAVGADLARRAAEYRERLDGYFAGVNRLVGELR